MACYAVSEKKFESYGNLQDWNEKYQWDNFVEYYRSDFKTIAAAQKRLPTRQMKTDLKYYQLTFACIHGGRRYNSVFLAVIFPAVGTLC